VPKSKVRKKPDAPLRTSSGSTVRALAPSPSWYPIVMAVVLVLGLAYMVVYYLTSSGTSPHIPIMAGLGAWNFAVGFGVMLLGLIMAVRWR
jgi:hydrogenase-4 membrane subunit HyfE